VLTTLKEQERLLEEKTAVVYGAGGHVGGAIARAFAREGATVHLAGRTATSLQAVADDIAAAGGRAHVAVVDALNQADVDGHADRVVQESGTLDISVNVISDQDVQGTPMVEMSVEDYLRPIEVAVRSKFLTSCAAARQMIRQGSGVILTFGGSFKWDVARRVHVGGMGTTFDAVEAMRRQMAAELGPHGIRVVTLWTGGLPETIPEDYAGAAEMRQLLVDLSLAGRTATLADVGNIAAFAASDLAAPVNGTINMTAGSVLD
jgi:NAD(P)-dependent dehydrogenase (short-subunit alcohol dehydrogenase family)